MGRICSSAVDMPPLGSYEFVNAEKLTSEAMESAKEDHILCALLMAGGTVRSQLDSGCVGSSWGCQIRSYRWCASNPHKMLLIYVVPTALKF